MNIKKTGQFLFVVVSLSLCLSIGASADTYSYDNLNRLTAVAYDNGTGQTYSYDAAGNLLSMNSATVNTGTDIAIGKTYQGGIVFYIDSTGKHGLIAAPTDQSSGIQWQNGYYSTTGATGTAIGTGLANTNAIIIAQGEGSYAAKMCADLVIGAYSDWYLPSKDELNLMYHNIGQGAAAPLTNVGGFAGYDNYWSSSEDDYNNVWTQSFGFGYESAYNKKSEANMLYVRAVRAF